MAELRPILNLPAVYVYSIQLNMATPRALTLIVVIAVSELIVAMDGHILGDVVKQ